MATRESTSKSSAIRDIENKYGINLTTCTRAQLDTLTSCKSRSHSIKKLSDLMINCKQFDLHNMTDIERANLKYLVMSTEELLTTLERKSKSIYYKPQEARLRWLMSYNDFYQICAYKLLLNDGILRFNANYKLDPAVYCWLLRTAMWQTYRKATSADEVTILDKPCGDDTDTTIGELMLKDSSYTLCDVSVDSEKRIEWILSLMDKTPNSRIVLKANSTIIQLSEYNLAKLFMVYHLGKKELSKMMFNTSNNKLVSNQIFNKFYKNTMIHIAQLLNEEANECGETFSINENDL
jgi:hypothetical protein